MKTPFYINADVLEKPWGSKHDVMIMVLFITAVVAASLAFIIITKQKLSIFTRIGIAGAYLGILFGVFGHLRKQITKGDEFVNKIITAAIAYGGLYTILLVAMLTVFQSIRGMDNLASWNLIAPVFFLFMTYGYARMLAQKYAK
ncbi:MAG: hypothetical protein JKY25_11840 [Robiginitomaculum sp.]|nr:hypothetical protein [Robiginitomaculum sp.]